MGNMIKLLGFIDILAGLIMLSFIIESDLPIELIVFVVLSLLLKAGLDIFDPGSITDLVVAGLIIFGLFLSLPFWLPVGAGVIITFKGFRSLF